MDRRVFLSAQKESALRVIPQRSELPSPLRKRRGVVLLVGQKAEAAGGAVLDVFEHARVNYLTPITGRLKG